MFQWLFLILSIGMSLLSYIFVNPVFYLLLPLSIIELVNDFVYRKTVILIFSLIPIFYLNNHQLKLSYGLIAVFCFLIFMMSDIYSKRLLKNESQIDTQRKQLTELTKNLHTNAEYLKQSEYTYKLEERNRISQEIHDKVGHSMTGALIQMEAAKSLLERDPIRANELLNNAITISRRGIEDIRMTVKNLKPPTELVGIHRLKLIVDNLNARQAIQTVMTYDGNLDVITPIQWNIIITNVTEALTNAMKYSKATLVSIDLKVLNKIIRVEVKDNGQGSEVIKKGLGLLGMEERTGAVNGQVIIDSTHGFSVTTILPIAST